MNRKVTFGIVGAYGATGRAVTAELLRSTDGEILCGGRDAAQINAFTTGLGGRVLPSSLDVLDARSLDEFAGRCAVILNCAGPASVLQDRVAQAALRARCHYVDPAGMSVVKERLLAASRQIADHGLSFVVSAGWMPGLTDLLPVYAHAMAQTRMESIEAVETYFSDSGEWSDSALRDGVAHLRNTGVAKPGYFRRGEWVRAKMAEASCKTDVGSPVGRRRFSLFSMPELDEVGRRMDQCDFRSYSYLAGFRNAIDAMMIVLGPRSEQAGVRRLRNIFRRNRVGVGGFVIVRVRGRAKGKPAVFRTSVTFDPGRDYWMTGVALATAARLIASGQGVRGGVHFFPAAVEPGAVMAELRNAGVAQSEGWEDQVAS